MAKPAIQIQGRALHSPSWPPTEADWDVYRPLISQLYIDKNFKLDSIRCHLDTQYGFRATERMYKSRLKRWKLKKYFCAREKEVVAEILDACRINGTKAPSFSSDGVSVPLHVVRRHCRRKRIFTEACEDLPYAPPAKEKISKDAESEFEHNCVETPSQASASSNTTSSPQKPASRLHRLRQMPIDATLDKIQNVFTLTNQYFLWHLDSDLTNQSLENFPRPSHTPWDRYPRRAMNARSFEDLIGQGLDHLVEGRTRNGWKSIRASCEMLRTVLSEQHRALLRFICTRFSDFRWQQFPDLWLALFRYFADMSVIVLGETQPLSIIFRLFRDPSVFQGSSKIILKVILDTCRQRLCKREVGELEREHCNILRHTRDYVAAENAGLSLVSRCEEVYGCNDGETRRALRRLANVYLDQRLEKQAEQVYDDILARGRESLGAAFPDDSGIFTYQDLARLSTYRGDWEQAEEYWRLAYDGAVKLFGAPDGTSCYCTKHHNTLYALRTALDSAKNVEGNGFIPYPWRTVEKVVCVGQECCAGRYGLINSSWPM